MKAERFSLYVGATIIADVFAADVTCADSFMLRVIFTAHKLNSRGVQTGYIAGRCLSTHASWLYTLLGDQGEGVALAREVGEVVVR